MQENSPQELKEYLDYFWIQTAEEYSSLLIDNLQTAVATIDEKAILSDRHHFKRIPESHKWLLAIINSKIKWLAHIGSDAFLLVRLWRGEYTASSIETVAIHEGEHYFQNSLAGNLLDTDNKEQKLLWVWSPIFRLLFKYGTETFKDLHLPVKHQHEPFRNQRQVIYSELKQLFRDIVDPTNTNWTYYWNLREILARIRQIQAFLDIDWPQSFDKQHITRLEAANNQVRKKLKNNIISEEKFIDFMKLIY
jgi:hypothetical protein